MTKNDKKALKDYPAPWHLEGPFDLDGKRWGSDIAIVAANGDCVIHRWGGADWDYVSEFLVNTVNLQAGFKLPARPKAALVQKAKKA